MPHSLYYSPEDIFSNPLTAMLSFFGHASHMAYTPGCNTPGRVWAAWRRDECFFPLVQDSISLLMQLMIQIASQEALS